MRILRAHPEPDGWGGFTAEELADPHPTPSLRILRAAHALAVAQEHDMLRLPDGRKTLPYFEIGDRVQFAEPLVENAVLAELGKTGVVTSYGAEKYFRGWELTYFVRADEVGQSVDDGCYRGYQLALVQRAENPPFWRRGHDLAVAEHRAWLQANHPEITHRMWLLANYPEHPGNLRPATVPAAFPGAETCTLEEYRTEVQNRRLLGLSEPSAFDHALGKWLASITPEEFAAWDRKEDGTMHKRLQDLGFLLTFETNDEQAARHDSMSRPAIMREMRESLAKVGIIPSAERTEQLYASNWLGRLMRRVYQSLRKSDTE